MQAQIMVCVDLLPQIHVGRPAAIDPSHCVSGLREVLGASCEAFGQTRPHVCHGEVRA